MDSDAIYIAPHHNGAPGQFIAWHHQPSKPDFPMTEGSAEDCIQYVNTLCTGTGWESVDAYIQKDGVWHLVRKQSVV